MSDRSVDARNSWISKDGQGRQWPPDDAARVVRQIYNLLLDRDADDGGLVYWSGKLQSGEHSVRETVRLIGSSAEFFTKHIASFPVVDSAATMYRKFLCREAENHYVKEFWAKRIADDWRSAVSGFVDSAEYRGRFGDDAVPHP